ncbi:MAG TPA: NAD-dependent epimerase/dehydratase family protein [Gemmatimonadales bacterium]|nr:NAD-dependent epimerase/dehydratase family protein [Gemmatimonadales bacterium]
MKAFVTGGTGFVGSHLVEALLARGHQVRCLVRTPAKAAALFGTPGGLELVVGDLEDNAALRRGAADVDHVFHVAGLTGAWRKAELHRVNRGGTERVLAAAASAAPRLARFVHVSTLSAAGPSRRGTPRRESDPDTPVSGYGRSKLAAESAVRAGPVPWTIVRPPSVYGPRDVEFLRLFRLAKLGVVPFTGDPDQELSLVHGRDLAAAILAATAPACTGRTYYACHPEVVSGRTLVSTIARAVNETLGRPMERAPALLAIPSPIAGLALWASGALAALRGRATPLTLDKLPELRAEAWVCSPAALERDTGWRATIALEEGARDTARWYRERGWV